MVRPEGRTAKCVQSFDDSQDSAIHISYRNLLRSSSMQEPRHPLPKVIREIVFSSLAEASNKKGLLHKFKMPTRRIAHDLAVSIPNHETPRLARSELTKVLVPSLRREQGNAIFTWGPNNGILDFTPARRGVHSTLFFLLDHHVSHKQKCLLASQCSELLSPRFTPWGRVTDSPRLSKNHSKKSLKTNRGMYCKPMFSICERTPSTYLAKGLVPTILCG